MTFASWQRAVAAWRDKGEKVRGASPIGCVLVLDGEVVAEGHNEVGLRHDPTAHAEIVAIRRACESVVDGTSCAARCCIRRCSRAECARWQASGAGSAAWSTGPGANDVHRMYFEDRHLDTMNFVRDAFRVDFEVMGGVMKDEVAGLYWGTGG